MKKLTTWMLVLMLLPGVVALTGCKQDEPAEDMGEMEPMAEATPTPMMAEPMMEATPSLEATPSMDAGAMDAAATPSPAAQ